MMEFKITAQILIISRTEVSVQLRLNYQWLLITNLTILFEPKQCQAMGSTKIKDFLMVK